MDELRVALFTGNYNHIKDGVSLTLNRLVAFLEKKGISVLVFAPTIDEPELDHNGRLVALPSVRMPVSGRGEYRLTLGMSVDAEEALADFNPNLIHIATPDRGGLKALRWAQAKDIQVVGSYHTHFTSYLKYYNLQFIEFLAWQYLSWFYNSCEHTYVPSPSMADELKNHGFKSDLRIWARGVNTSLFNPEKRSHDWRQSHGFAEDDIVVTFVSRLVWEKELNTYLRSVQQIGSKNEKVKALIVGDGPARAELEEKMPEAVFTGFIEGEELARAYASSDIFFFPSHTETFGNVTLEAMSSGLPCLVADAVGSKSLVNDGENGLLGTPGDLKDFTQKLDHIVHDDDMREKMSKASRKHALEYDWDQINENLVRNYREALKSKPHRK